VDDDATYLFFSSARDLLLQHAGIVDREGDAAFSPVCGNKKLSIIRLTNLNNQDKQNKNKQINQFGKLIYLFVCLFVFVLFVCLFVLII
tara:strand:- start:61 stop:327 length:267 start_codon:yes stop_codon:yes gene_type:complete